MGRHVVRALVLVVKGPVAVRDQSREEGLQVMADRRIGVLADDQRGAGVLDEAMTETAADNRLAHRLLDLGFSFRYPTAEEALRSLLD